MIPAVLTAALAVTLLWVMYDGFVDLWILGEYQSVISPLIGMAFFCEAVFHLMSPT